MNHDAIRGSPIAPSARVSPALREFVAHLRQKATPAGADDDAAWRSEKLRQVSQAEDLAARFAAAAQKAGALVHFATLQSAAAAVHGIVEHRSARRVHVPPADDGALRGPLRRQVLSALSHPPVNCSSETCDAALFSAEASVTGASAAVAETGTVICTTAGGRARGSTLYAPLHIVLIGRSQILPDLCDYFDAACMQGELPSNVNLITGPSKTADIEGVLIVGVHGPGALHVVVIDDA